MIFLVRVKLPNTEIHTFQANMTEWGHYGMILSIFGTVGKCSRIAAAAWNTYSQCHPPNMKGKSRNHLLVQDKNQKWETLWKLDIKFRIHVSCSENPALTLRAIAFMPSVPCTCLVPHTEQWFIQLFIHHFNIICELLTHDEVSET